MRTLLLGLLLVACGCVLSGCGNSDGPPPKEIPTKSGRLPPKPPNK